MERRYGVNLDENSHGQSFLKLFQSRFVPGRIVSARRTGSAAIAAEPAGAHVDDRRHDAGQDAQFIIATHSPILLGFPGATIYSCDQVPMARVEYDELDHVVITRDFLNARERFLKYSDEARARALLRRFGARLFVRVLGVRQRDDRPNDAEEHDGADDQAEERGLGVGAEGVRLGFVCCVPWEGRGSGDADGVHDVVLLELLHDVEARR